MTPQVDKPKPATFTDLLRSLFKGVLDKAGAFLNSLGLTPNAMTILGFAGNVVAAYLLAIGQITWGGVVVLLMGPIDALDGAMARQRGKPTRYGAFLDSVTDRYSELVIYAGLLAYFLQQDSSIPAMLVFFAAAGSVLVSYVKARGEAVGYNVNAGILTRVERYLVLTPLLIINQPVIALWIISILANFTALQRILFVRKQADAQGDILKK